MITSKRLAAIQSLITQPYDAVWDCCCDHGLLGIELLKDKNIKQVHFNDISEPLIQQLSKKLTLHKTQLPSNSSWQLHCEDAARLDLKSSGKRQLIIIAGVGGDQTITIVQSLLKQHASLDLEFILCPVHHTYKVRHSLMLLKLNLISEMLVTENKRFYEIIHITNNHTRSQTLISPVGDSLWHKQDKNHKAYLNKTIAHYQRCLTQNNDAKINTILDQYNQVLNSL